RALAKQLHPDMSEASGSESSESFQRLQEAYDVLRDPERRARYDRELARRAAMADAARLSAHRPIPPRSPPNGAPRSAPKTSPNVAARPTTRRRLPLALRLRAMRGYLSAIGLVVLVTAGIAAWQLVLAPEPPAITIVKVDPDIRGQ